MHKLLKISAAALVAFATATAFAEEGEREYLHLKKEPSKEEQRKFCRYWFPIVKERKEGAFEGAERKEAKEGYERHCRKHEKEWREKGEGYEGRDGDDKKEKGDK